MDVRLPDGTIIQGVPEGTTKADLAARLQRNGMAVPAEWLAPGGAPAAAPAQPLTANRDLASQVGLTTRSMLKGVLAIPALGADAVGGLANASLDLIGDTRTPRYQPTLPTVDSLLTRMGFPQPDTPTQRVVSRAVELGTGAGASAQLANAGARGTAGVARDVLQRLSASPGTQITAGVGSGAAGQHSAEEGGGPISQFLSSLVGGLAGAGAAGGVKAAGRAIGRAASPATAAADIDRRITIALERQGMDPASITPAMRRALADDVAAALKTDPTGALDEGALARLADYRRLGLTPTRGRVTLDPIDVTREQNAMRVAAATGARDAQLPQIAQRNNQGLLAAMERLGPSADHDFTGSLAMRPVLARDARLQANEQALYESARRMAGGDIPLAQGEAMQNIFRALDAELKTPFLPKPIANVLNEISTGTRPYDTRTIDVLKTILATAQREAGDGNVRHALGIVRDQLDATPLRLGNAAAVQSVDEPARLMDALNTARAAAAARRAWQESAPGIRRALADRAVPDSFVRNNIINQGAGFKDVAQLANVINTDPGSRGAVQAAIVQHLKDAAVGRGNDVATSNFSGRQWMAALASIGDKKLGLFFAPDELETLKAIGRVGAAETFQPRGSAVNNSNTAAGVASLVQGAAKHLVPLANKVPFGSAAVSAPLDNITISLLERGATQVPRSLVLKPVPPLQQPGLLDPLLLPMLGTGALLPPVNP